MSFAIMIAYSALLKYSLFVFLIQLLAYGNMQKVRLSKNGRW